ncbi:helix-turn-helix transcriptional regulator [Flavobacterium sp. H122]|uniref:helix-turn-helix domain-containing protein n=1 Tax=Flavobacterium sp. H122 TaxID=2529860 RepID=UPI0010AA11E1|nr:transcriptional regulator [Flavobacterium sp. H122]
MASSSDFRNALGISQEEAAMLLGVSRSQFSLFELGKRSLPTKAMVAYVEMWSYVQEKAKLDVDKNTHTALDKEKIKIALEAQLAEMQYKQKFLQKKIVATEVKYKKAQAALHLVDYLRNKSNPNQEDFIRLLEMNARKKMEKHGVVAQTKLQIELKSVVSYHKQLLDF